MITELNIDIFNYIYSKDIEIEFDSDLLPDGNYSLSVVPYNK